MIKHAFVLVLATLTAFTTGCVSGGFKLTRTYAQFVNRQHVVLRVILYVLTFVIFGVTMLIDAVINNTMDFWDGRVSQGTYHFTEGSRSFVARHEIGADGMKSSHIEIYDQDRTKLQDVRLTQTSASNVDVYVDGVLKHRVSDLHSLPRLTTFHGPTSTTRAIPLDERLIAAR